jgi:hypothetical protein
MKRFKPPAHDHGTWHIHVQFLSPMPFMCMPHHQPQQHAAGEHTADNTSSRRALTLLPAPPPATTCSCPSAPGALGSRRNPSIMNQTTY